MRFRRITRAVLLAMSVLAGILLPTAARAVEPVWTTLIQGPDTGYGMASVTHDGIAYVLLEGTHNAREVCRLAQVDASGNVTSIHRVASNRKGLNCPDLVGDDSGLYLAISSIGRLDGVRGGGGWDAYLRKLDYDGNELWTSEFGTAGMEVATSVASTGDGVVLGGYTFAHTPTYESDAFVKRYDVAGNLLWTRRIRGDLDEIVWDLAADAKGVYVGLLYLRGGERVAVMRFGADGTRGWTWSFGSFVGNVEGMVVGSDGRLIVGGGTAVDLRRGMEPIPWNVFLVAIDTADGTPVWIGQFGADLGAVTMDVATGPAGVYVTGWVPASFPAEDDGDTAAFVRAYDVNGHPRWHYQFGTRAVALAINADTTGVTSMGLTRADLGGAVQYQATFVRRIEPA